MITPDNDTLSAEEQNLNQTKADKSETRKAMIAKILASAGAGMITGAGSAYAVVQFAGSENVDESAEDIVQNRDTIEQQDTEIAKPTEPVAEEMLVEIEAKERIRTQHEQVRQQHEVERQQHEDERQQHEDERQQHEDERQQHEDERQQHEVERQQRENERQQHEDERQQHENERQQHENERQQHENECQLQENDNKQNNDYFRNHDVKVESSEVIILKDGSRMRIYDATVDGHEAIFLGDEDRHIVGAVIDENGNGTPEENELVDLRQYNITEQQLYVHHVEEPTHDVDVIAVEHDVLIDGQLTDVATVTIDDQPVLFIDANQNGEVDLAITDQNQNDQIDEGEIEDISGYHIAMPTEDDVTGTLLSSAGDNTDDYSNDANVELYEV